MNSTAARLTHEPPPPASSPPLAARPPGSASPSRPHWGEVFAQTGPLIVAPAFFGPPIIYVLGPWLLLVLLLIGPFALIFTLLLVAAAAACLLTVCVAVIASPYLLMRHLHAHRPLRAKLRAPLQLFQKPRVSSGRLGSPQPKGMS
jgi:hypothetical protein